MRIAECVCVRTAHVSIFAITRLCTASATGGRGGKAGGSDVQADAHIGVNDAGLLYLWAPGAGEFRCRTVNSGHSAGVTTLLAHPEEGPRGVLIFTRINVYQIGGAEKAALRKKDLRLGHRSTS